MDPDFNSSSSNDSKYFYLVNLNLWSRVFWDEVVRLKPLAMSNEYITGDKITNPCSVSIKPGMFMVDPIGNEFGERHPKLDRLTKELKANLNRVGVSGPLTIPYKKFGLVNPSPWKPNGSPSRGATHTYIDELFFDDIGSAMFAKLHLESIIQEQVLNTHNLPNLETCIKMLSKV